MSIADTIEDQKALTSTLPGMRISEIILKTKNFTALKDWWEVFVGFPPFFLVDDSGGWSGTRGIAFFRLHVEFPFTQVVGIFEIDDAGGAPQPGPGMHHCQLRHASFDDCVTRYERLKQCGIEPVESWNHGPSTSFYYRDLDQNMVEISGSNYETEADYLAYFSTEAYQKNFAGIEIDPVEFVARYRGGKALSELVKIDA